jgi:hypothetical protein
MTAFILVLSWLWSNATRHANDRLALRYRFTGPFSSRSLAFDLDFSRARLNTRVSLRSKIETRMKPNLPPLLLPPSVHERPILDLLPREPVRPPFLSESERRDGESRRLYMTV